MAAEHLIGVNLATFATLSMTNEDLNYPATNGNNKMPWDPLKSTTVNTVITLTFSGDVTLEAFSIIHHNLVGATVDLANGVGFLQPIVIPARTSRGRCVNPWLDMRGLANTTDDVWTLTVAGALANVSIGEIVAVGTLSDLPLVVNEPPEFGERELVEIITTSYGVRRKLEYHTRMRHARGRLVEDVDQATVYALWQTVGGVTDPFLFIPDVDINDAWLAEFDSDTVQWSRSTPNVHPMSIGLTEVSGGLVP